MNVRSKDKIARFAFLLAAMVTILILVLIIFYVLFNGLRVVTFEFLTSPIKEMGKEGGIFPTIISSIYLALLSIIIATPLAVGTAVFLTEYTRENVATKIIRFGANCLAGIPSIIFGLFGFVFFVIYLRFGWSILSGSLTLACMILPTIIRTSEEAIKSVSYTYKEVTYALGGTKLQGIYKIVLPKALPGILTGIILGMGRAIEETAVLIFTAGLSIHIPTSVFSSGRSMAVHFYTLAREGISIEKAFGTAAVLVISILIINSISYFIMYRFMRKYT